MMLQDGLQPNGLQMRGMMNEDESSGLSRGEIATCSGEPFLRCNDSLCAQWLIPDTPITSNT